jgi:hypothetical protein
MNPSLTSHAKGVYTIMVVLLASWSKATGQSGPSNQMSENCNLSGLTRAKALNFSLCVAGGHRIMYFPIMPKGGFVTPVSLQVAPSIGSTAQQPPAQKCVLYSPPRKLLLPELYRYVPELTIL